MADLEEMVGEVSARAPGLILGWEPPPDSVEIRSVDDDSRRVESGSLFCAVRGVTTDGHEWIEPAVAKGAVAVLAEEIRTASVPTVVTSNARRATAHFAAELYGHPSDEIDVVGVTGTNGKTTVVTLIEHVGRSLGRRARSMGTLTGSLTTLPAPDFQRELRRAADDGVDLLATEVSSHALDQHRVDATRFSVALFTNLTQDHLDYHADMEQYFAAKSRLFTDGLAELGIIDISTDYGQRLADIADIPVRPVDPRTVDVVEVGPAGCVFDIPGVDGDGPTGSAAVRVELPLGGRFNIGNALLVIETFLALGHRLSDVVAAIENIPQVPGRFEWIAGNQPFGVVVDYSHTPASLEAAISTSAEIGTNRVIVVFGSGGDRDPGKRPLMGRAAATADMVIVTSDNPRSEDPMSIIAAITDGLVHPDLHIEPDRQAAIRLAIGRATTGDVVLIAGKGHETTQTIGETIQEFDDRQVARAALTESGWEVAA